MQSQIILITGASSGFGKITSQMLSEQGHIVYGTSRKTSENMGKVKIRGMKNNPCRLAARILARTGFLHVCASMLLPMIKGQSA